jgi:hypothetical protein
MRMATKVYTHHVSWMTHREYTRQELERSQAVMFVNYLHILRQSNSPLSSKEGHDEVSHPSL